MGRTKWYLPDNRGLLEAIKKAVCGSYVARKFNAIIVLLKTIITFALVDFSWIFFRAKTIHESKEILKGLRELLHSFNINVLFDGSIYELGVQKNEFIYVLIAIMVLLIVDIFKYRKVDVTTAVLKSNVVIRYLVLLVLFWAVIMTGIYGVEYDASQFIYFQF